MQIHKLQFSTVSVVRSAAFALLLALASAAFGQSFDTSGNGTLKGAYFVRELLLTGQNGSSVAAISVVGTMTFDGNGNYATVSNKGKGEGWVAYKPANAEGYIHLSAIQMGTKARVLIDGAEVFSFSNSIRNHPLRPRRIHEIIKANIILQL